MTLPLHIYIVGYQLSLPLAGIILFTISFYFCFWLLCRNKVRPVLVFDMIFISLLTSLLTSRVLAVLNNLGLYLTDPLEILNFFDRKFLFSGFFLGIVLSSFLLYRIKSKEVKFFPLLERLLISYALSSCFLIAGLFLGGKLLGIVNNSTFGLIYEDGVKRLPTAVISILYNLLFLGFWLMMRKAKFKLGILSAVYLMGYATFEFILRFFSNGYNPNILVIFDLPQLIHLLILVIGILILGNAYNIKVINMPDKENGPEPVRRKFDISYGREPLSPRDRFSLSYSDSENSRNVEDMTLKEKLRILNNTVKRKFRK